MFSVIKESMTLKSGDKIPILGMGTWQSEPGEVGKAVKLCLDAGYRHLDCAAVYENEKEIGQVLSTEFKNGLDRKDLWVTSKLWNTKHRREDVLPALEKTIADLQVTYLDLYLIHFPISYMNGDAPLPRLQNGRMKYDADAPFIETYKEMELAVEKGLAKNIGISNFNVEQIEQVMAICKIKPSVLQVECHPYLPQAELKKYCDKKGIVFISYSPLGSPGTPYSDPDTPSVLIDDTLLEIAEKHKKTIAQVLLRYHIDRKCVVIPKSVNPDRIKANMDVFDFTLDKDDFKKIDGITRRFRYNTSLRDFYSPYYPHHVGFI